MIKNKYVLTQILSLINRYQFNKIVAQYSTNERPLSFTHWEHFICLSYGQLTHKESLRNIVLGLKSRSSRLYHLGIRSPVSLSTLSNANRTRSWLIYRNLAYALIEKATKADFNRKIFSPEDTPDYLKFNTELPQVIYALDASIISLCLSVFHWAKFRKKRVELSSILCLI